MGFDPSESYEVRSRIVVESAKLVPSESVPLREANGRVLATPLVARIDSPRFDNSAVDGYAISEADRMRLDQGAELDLRWVGISRAGAPHGGVVTPGTTVQTLTGAVLAPGTAGIVMQEDTDRTGDYVTVRPGTRSGHVRRMGEDFRAGDTILPGGTWMTPPAVGIAASAGFAELEVRTRPRIAILTTGDELRTPGEPLTDGDIYESNSFTLRAVFEAFPVEIVAMARASDEDGALASIADRLLHSADIVVTTGGVSVGEFDRVREVFRGLGVEEVFWRSAIKPGKPIWFGQHPSGVAVFGLPGNPMSAVVTAVVFALPYLRACLGLPRDVSLTASLGTSLRSRIDRTEFIAARIELVWDRLVAHPLGGRASHLGLPLVSAHGWVILPPQAEAETGSPIEWLPAPWARFEYPGGAP